MATSDDTAFEPVAATPPPMASPDLERAKSRAMRVTLSAETPAALAAAATSTSFTASRSTPASPSLAARSLATR